MSSYCRHPIDQWVNFSDGVYCANCGTQHESGDRWPLSDEAKMITKGRRVGLTFSAEIEQPASAKPVAELEQIFRLCQYSGFTPELAQDYVRRQRAKESDSPQLPSGEVGIGQNSTKIETVFGTAEFSHGPTPEEMVMTLDKEREKPSEVVEQILGICPDCKGSKIYVGLGFEAAKPCPTCEGRG